MMKFLRKFELSIRTKIREWLGIHLLEQSCRPFMALDIGYHEASALVLIKRNPKGSMDYVEIINFHPGANQAQIVATVRDLGRRYGVNQKDFVQDLPRGVERIKL